MIEVKVQRHEVQAKCLVGGVGFLSKQVIQPWEYNRVESESQVQQRHIKEVKRMLALNVSQYFHNVVTEMKHEIESNA